MISSYIQILIEYKMKSFDLFAVHSDDFGGAATDIQSNYNSHYYFLFQQRSAYR